jgi:hypothetical protein
MALRTLRALLTRCLDTRVASLDYLSVTRQLILGCSVLNRHRGERSATRVAGGVGFRVEAPPPIYHEPEF